MANDEGGMDALRALGARTVPVVAKGDRYVFAQSLKVVAEFVGLAGDFGPALAPPELISRLDRILAGVQRFVRQLPEGELETKLKNRNRTYRQLGHHVFRIPEAFVDAVGEGRQLTYEALTAPPPENIRSGYDIAEYGSVVRQKVRNWWDSTSGGGSLPQMVDTYYGQQPLHEVLERTTWHAGQHARQLMSILEDLGIAADQPLTEADFAGLPMPQNVWDD